MMKMIQLYTFDDIPGLWTQNEIDETLLSSCLHVPTKMLLCELLPTPVRNARLVCNRELTWFEAFDTPANNYIRARLEKLSEVEEPAEVEGDDDGA